MAAPAVLRDGIGTEKRETVVEAIAQKLIRYIAENRLAGGDRLPSERDLVRMVGASRLPLREALCVLKGLGIIEARHGKGIFVKQLDLAAVFGMLSPLMRSQSEIDVQQIFEARLHLEASIAELAATHRTEEDLAVMGKAISGMRAGLQNRRKYVRHDMAFHQQLACSTGNPVFRVFMASITELLAEVHFSYRDDVQFIQAAIEEHEQILQAVQAQAKGRARRAMQQHLRNAMGRV